MDTIYKENRLNEGKTMKIMINDLAMFRHGS